MALEQHILVMSFIGEHCRPAPKLKGANLRGERLYDAYEQVIEAMKTMYEKANLIHADLSEDNVLWFEEYCYLIDAGQAVEPTDVNALQLLYKDCQKITDFFVKWKNVRDIFTADELFKYITSCYFNDEIANHVIGRVVGKTAPPQK